MNIKKTYKTMKNLEDLFYLSKINESWKDFFFNEFKKEKLIEILEKVNLDSKEKNCYPKNEDVFRLFRELSLEDIKVVIIGQDPYHQPGIADGFAFSTRKENFIPASLKNIFKELNEDIKCSHEKENGDLTSWVEQGVFLINTSLTVRESQQKSHSELWREFTYNLSMYINKNRKDIIWIFWGKDAKLLRDYCKIDPKMSISGAHPSPFSASFGFFGSKPFSRVNHKLSLLKKTKIDWCV